MADELLGVLAARDIRGLLPPVIDDVGPRLLSMRLEA